jgi:hypothetical protein
MGRSRRNVVRALAALAVLAVLFVPRRAPATIQEQRERLPPPAECGEDIVQGIWKSHKFDDRFGEWVIFTLEIHRLADQPHILRGKITNHSWVGGPTNEEPPPCGASSGEWVVETDAEGSIDPSGRIRFRGVGDWRLVQRICPQNLWGGYNLDYFDGVIDTSLNEFQTHNNDGGRDVNEPYVFRRISCFPEGSELHPHIVTEPPEFYPDRSGCSCGLF